MDFVNRQEELEFLNKQWQEEGTPQFIVLYGKRRVGKTELVTRFASYKPHIYHLCEMIAPQKQLHKSRRGKANRQEYFCLFSKSGFTDEMLALTKQEHVFLFIEDKQICSSCTVA